MNEKMEQQSTSSRVSAGVRMTVLGPLASMSSWTTALLRTTVPTRVRRSWRAGLGGGPAPDVSSVDWAFE